MNLSYELIKHVKRKYLSAISTAKYIYDTIYIIVDHRVGIFPFSVNKCDVTVLLPYTAAAVTFQSVQPTKWSFCRSWYDSGKLC